MEAVIVWREAIFSSQVHICVEGSISMHHNNRHLSRTSQTYWKLLGSVRCSAVSWSAISNRGQSLVTSLNTSDIIEVF